MCRRNIFIKLSDSEHGRVKFITHVFIRTWMSFEYNYYFNRKKAYLQMACTFWYLWLILAQETAMLLRRGFDVTELSNYILSFVLFTSASDFSLFESFHSSFLQILLSLRLAGSKSKGKKYIKNNQILRNEHKTLVQRYRCKRPERSLIKK